MRRDGWRGLQLFLRGIHDNAAGIAARLMLQGREWYRDRLVADAKVLSDIDEGCCHLAVCINHDVLYGAEVLPRPIVEIASDVFIGCAANRDPPVW